MIPVPADPERSIKSAAENKQSDLKNHQKAEAVYGREAEF